MAIDRGHYEGRPQALVKHTFLNEYLPALANKVCSSWDSFAYVDGFAGPWQAVDEQTFSDTSFGIALKAMADAQEFQRKTRNRSIRMVAHLVEKDATAFARLQGLANQFPTIEVHAYQGEFQRHLPTILAKLDARAFCFSFIDPKGVSLDLAVLRPLLVRNSSEALVNFMFDFVNRFVSHPNPNIIDTMNRLIPGANWRDLLDVAKAAGASSEAREGILVDGFRSALRATGKYDFVTSLIVQKPLADRTLYHLVFGTRSPWGLSVFRDSQIKALKTQADIRASEKSKAKTERSGQPDLYSGVDTIPLDPSSREIADGKSGAIEFAESMINSHDDGIRWSVLWPAVLQKFTVREIVLARGVYELNRAGAIHAPGWRTDRYTKPQDHQMFARRSD
jgi:three-Cys-motif partner protein